MKKKKYILGIAICILITVLTGYSTADNILNNQTMNSIENNINIIDYLEENDNEIDNTIVDSKEEKTHNIEEEIKDNEVEEKDKNETIALPNGIYKIYSKLSTDRLIEAPNNSRSQKTYFKLGENTNTASQKFQITRNTDSTYTIQVLNSFNALDVKDGKVGNRVQVWQYKNNGTNAQKWYIEKNTDGSYTFKSKLDKSYVLDINNGSTNIGTNIQIYKGNGTNSQKFILEECAKEKGSKTIEDGRYKIVSSANTKKALTRDGQIIELNANTASDKQKYKFEYQGNGYYKIIIPGTNEVLTANNNKITIEEDKDLDKQKWIVKKQDKGYSLVSKESNLYVDLPNGSTQNGTKLQLYRENDTEAQQFILISMEQTVEDGIYKIYSKLGSNRLIEDPNNSRSQKTYFKLGANANTASQKFEIKFDSTDGAYTIKVLSTLNAMDVKDGKVGNRVQVWQYKSNGTDAQKWYIEKNTDGSYMFRSKIDTSYVLDVNNASTSIGTNIQIYKGNGTDSQKFILEECAKEKGTQTIEDGIYRIILNANRNKAVKLKNGKIEIAEDVMSEEQKYEFEYQGDGYYKIIIPGTNNVLTVENSKIKEEEDKNLDTQKWIVKKQGGVYNLVAKESNLYMDLPNASTEDGNEIQVYRENDTIAQQFILVNLTPEEITTDIQEGIYQIVLTNNKVVDVSSGSYNNRANIQTWGNDKVQQQKFRITKVEGTDYYEITAIHSAKAMDVENGNCKIGTNIFQYEKNNTSSQQWYFKETGKKDEYNIISVRNGLYVDISGGIANKDGQNVQLYFGNDSDAQKFKLVPIDIINEGTYEIESKLNSNMILDVSNASKSDGGNVQIWQADNVNQQRFILSSKTNEEYSIKAKHSNKVLTVEENGNVVQYTDKGTDNQRWIIKETGNGYYNLISKETGKVLDVSDAKDDNGTNVQTYSSNGTNAQAFRFVSGFRKFFEEGSYGTSGLSKKGDKRGTNLKYYKYGKGNKVYFATFSIHGFEDSYDHDGEELTYIANEFKKYLDNNLTESLVNEWTIYIFPNLNPDGQKYGTTNNGPGRTTLYSSAPKHKGIDMNRNWSTGFTKYTDNRNYNGTAAFQAYEAKALRDFLLEHQGKENVLVDLHGWLNETIGDNGIGKYYRNEFGMSKHISTYGRGYLVNWARSNLKNGRSSLVELPEVSKHSQVVSRKYANKYINATIKILKEI